MTTINPHPDGHFCWNQIATHNVDRTIVFYSALFGWEIVEEELDHGDAMVRMLHNGEFVVGVHQVKKDEPPRWEPHLAVNDLKSFLQLVQDHGGVVEEEPQSALPYGTMAEIKSPSGTRLCLWSAASFGGHNPQPQTGIPTWYELLCPEGGPKQNFWPTVLNWTPTSTDENSTQYKAESGTTVAGFQAIGSTSKLVLRQPEWIPYIQVNDVEATCTDAAAIDGSVVAPPYDVPGLGRCAIIVDPQGGIFGVIQPG